jgi:hypothetical protein
MTAPQAGHPTTLFATVVGRYFTVVSVVPSLLLVAFVVVLHGSGAWSREPDAGAGVRALAQLGLGGIFALVVGSLALGAVLHPLQFALVQFLEGYWGVNSFWTALRENGIQFHRERRAMLVAYGKVHQREVRALKASKKKPARHPVLPLSNVQAAERLRLIYPGNSDDMMPTRLGNVLRGTERAAGAAVKLDSVTFALHMMMVAPRAELDYVDDQRTSMDLAVRSCLVCLLGCLVTIVYLWPHRLWLLVALVPLGLAWTCYRGAVTAAQGYGAAVRMLFDLNRFALYERMGFPFPATTAAEREIVTAVTALGSGEEIGGVIRYRHPSAPKGS